MKRLPKKLAAAFQSVLDDLGSDASRRGYRSDWASYTAWLEAEEIPVLKATPQVVKRYVVKLAKDGKAARTRSRHLSVVREVYRAFVEAELLAVNPAREVKNVKQGKAGKPVTWLEEEQLAKMLAFGPPGKPPICEGVDDIVRELDWIDRRDRMCIHLLAGTGRRRAEVARMRVEDFTDLGVTGVVKGGAEKTAPVPLWLKREISDWCGFAGIKAGPLLPRSPEDTEEVSGDQVYMIVKRVAKAVGIDPTKVAPHTLRRTLATLSERRNVPLGDIQAQLNHASRSTTEHYLHGSRRVEEAPGEWMKELVQPKEVTS